MNVVLQILLQLGANETVFIQFGLFVVTISFLTVVVYGPYFKAYDQRMNQTKGADQVADETQNEAKKLEVIYQTKAREINEKIKSIYEDIRKGALDQVSTVINAGKSQVSATADQARAQIQAQKNNAEKDLALVSQEVATEISKKLTGAV